MNNSSNERRTDAPTRWPVVLLDSVADRGSGHTPDKKRPEYWDGDIKWISLADSDRLDRTYISDTVRLITPAGIANSSAVEHPSGTVVLSRDAGVGKSAITQGVMAVSQHFMAWRCGPQLDNHFLYHWLQSKKPEFERVAAGNTIKTIGLPYFKRLEIPLPPALEQRAIVAALNDVDALIAALERLIAKKRDIKQAAMQQLLTGRTRLPGFSGEWLSGRLGDVIGALEAGVSVNSTNDNEGTHEAFVLKTSAVSNGRFLSSERKRIASADVGRAKLNPRKDSILVSRMNTADLVGECGYVARDFPTLFVPDRLWLTRLRDPEGTSARWLSFVLSSPSFRRRISSAATGTSGSMKNLSKKSFLRLTGLFPPVAEQTAIAAVLSDMDAEITAIEQRRDKTRLIKQGMMQELLTGKTRLV